MPVRHALASDRRSDVQDSFVTKTIALGTPLASGNSFSPLRRTDSGSIVPGSTMIAKPRHCSG